MKNTLSILFAVFLAFVSQTFFADDAEARRLGGGRSFGMSRNVAPPTQSALPARAATAPSQPPVATPAPARRGWLGPLAGLAAGIGLAALLSHFGLGEELAGFLMLMLLVFGALFVFRLLTRTRTPQTGLQYAGAGDAAAARFEMEKVGAGGTATTGPIPAGFDVTGFLRQAKLNFTRLQAANDRGDLGDLQEFTTPEVFAELKMQFDERNRVPQQTDVVELDADLLEVVTEDARHVASVRFHGLLREEQGTAPAAFDEVWHLVKPVDGGAGWRVAGIQQIG